MTPGGWLFMFISVGFVSLLLSWCIFKVLKSPESEDHIHSQADIDTHDDDT